MTLRAYTSDFAMPLTRMHCLQAPNVLTKMGGGGKKPKNPYEGATSLGTVPNAAYTGSVTLNQSYDIATRA